MLKKSDLLEALEKTTDSFRQPVGVEFAIWAQCLRIFLKEIPDDPLEECKHEWEYHWTGIGRCKKCDTSRWTDEPDPQPEIEWEKQIDEWFEPRPFYEANYDIEKGLKEYCYKGKRFKDLIKDFIKTEFSKMAEEIKKESYPTDMSEQNTDGYFRAMDEFNARVDEALKKRGVK